MSAVAKILNKRQVTLVAFAVMIIANNVVDIVGYSGMVESISYEIDFTEELIQTLAGGFLLNFLCRYHYLYMLAFVQSRYVLELYLFRYYSGFEVNNQILMRLALFGLIFVFLNYWHQRETTKQIIQMCLAER